MKFLLTTLFLALALFVNTAGAENITITLPQLCGIFEGQAGVLGDLKLKGATNEQMEQFIVRFVTDYPEYAQLFPGYLRMVSTLNEAPPRNQLDVDAFQEAVKNVCMADQGNGWLYEIEGQTNEPQRDNSTVDI